MTIINGFLSPEDKGTCFSAGFAMGYEIGYYAGRIAAETKRLASQYAVICEETTQRFGSFPDFLWSPLAQITDVVDLMRLYTFIAAKAESLEDVANHIDEIIVRQ